MAPAAFVFAARTPIPDETDPVWFSRYQSWRSRVFRKLWERSTEEERELNRAAYRSLGLTSNAAPG